MTGYQPGKECALCKGRCCREHGCVLSPDDLDSRILKGSRAEWVEFLTVSTCMYAIDRTQTCEGLLYYLRMRHKCYTFVGVDALGECIALTPSGCSLSFEKRPRGGRDLKSSPDFNCRQMYGIDEMISDWKPYRDILESIFTEYEERFEKDGTFDECDRKYFEMLKAADH